MLPLYGALRRAAQSGVRLLRLVPGSTTTTGVNSTGADMRPLPFVAVQVSVDGKLTNNS